MGFSSSRRRRKIRSRPFPKEWLPLVERGAPLFAYLSPADREELLQRIQVFLAEKNFEGCGGVTIDDEIRITVAAQASLLTLHRGEWYYPSLVSVVVYPAEYDVAFSEVDGAGVMTEGVESRMGETWRQGTLVLSWEDIRPDGAALMEEGINVVLHEFAHQLDEADGITSERQRNSALGSALATEYRLFCRLVRRRRTDTLLDPYGAESLAEFFAVAVEAFFEDPIAMRNEHPNLYSPFTTYFGLDPARLVENRSLPHGRG